jgi:hypothetical protein
MSDVTRLPDGRIRVRRLVHAQQTTYPAAVTFAAYPGTLGLV